METFYRIYLYTDLGEELIDNYDFDNAGDAMKRVYELIEEYNRCDFDIYLIKHIGYKEECYNLEDGEQMYSEHYENSLKNIN